MKAFICFSILAFTVVTQEQKTQESDCDQQFVKTILSAKRHCFQKENEEVFNEYLANVLLAQLKFAKRLSEDGEHFRTESSAGEISIPKEWSQQNQFKEEKHEIKPEKMKQLNDEMSCVEKAMQASGKYKKIQAICSSATAAGGQATDAQTTEPGHLRMACILNEVAKLCPKLIPYLLGVDED